ncbi:hypothetical protein [Desulfuromonas sp.]|uniref:NHL domain-containing protein n=1 Tax=Desulfuromonas sp. TaxID=892 RepID=UPI0025C1CC8D|nr:hypothetical protein [Desulfuromonas sp.]
MDTPRTPVGDLSGIIPSAQVFRRLFGGARCLALLLVFFLLLPGWAAAAGVQIDTLLGGTIDGPFEQPQGVVVATDGSVYVSDTNNNRVLRVWKDGTWQSEVYADGFSGPQDLALDPAGNVYVADTGNIRICKITAKNTVSVFATGSPLVAPVGLDYGSDTLYVADNSAHRIFSIDAGGTVSLFAGGGGGTGDNQTRFSLKMSYPTDVAVDGTNLYVVDSRRWVIRKIAADNSVKIVAGVDGSRGTTDGAGDVAKFALATRIAVKEPGVLFVTDTRYSSTHNHTIRRLDLDTGSTDPEEAKRWTVSTVAGTGVAGYSGDGGSGEIQFSSPRGLTLDSGGSIFIADTANHALRQILNDEIAPASGSISIVDGNPTNSDTVDLALTCDDGLGSGCAEMAFQNEAAAWGAWEAYAASRADWPLSSGDGDKTVSVKFKDGYGNESAVLDSASITLDTLAPTVSIDSVTSPTPVSSQTLGGAKTSDATGTVRVNDGDPVCVLGAGSSWSCDVGLTEGDNEITVAVSDAAGNTNSDTATITLDTAVPTGTVGFQGEATHIGDLSATLALACDDGVGSGCSQMQFSNDNSTWSGWIDYASSSSWDLAAGGDGSRTVYARYKDVLGNLSSTVSASVTYDTAAPTGGGVSIAEGADNTTTRSVTLSLSCDATGPDDCDMMQFSHNGTSWPYPWEDYSASKAWMLPSGDGAKTVYARFKDAAENTSAPVSDGILFDSTSPTGTAAVVTDFPGYVTSTVVDLDLSCSDGGSGCDQMRFSNDGSTWSDWEGFTTPKTGWTLPAGDGAKSVRVKYQDAAGNDSSPIAAAITLDTEAPATGTVAIDGGVARTGSRDVTLTLSGSAASMAFKNETGEWSEFEAFATTKSWTLTEGDGTKTVSVKLRSGAGNVSEAFSDTIEFDGTPPEGTLAVETAFSGYVASSPVTLAITAVDVGTVAKIHLSNDGVTYQEMPYATSVTGWDLSAGDGEKTVFLKFEDELENLSAAISTTFVLDSTLPSGSVTINGGAANTDDSSVSLGPSCDDGDGSGCAEMAFRNGEGAWSAWEAYATSRAGWTLTDGDGDKTVSVRFRDRAGNEFSPEAASILFDTADPTGSFTIREALTGSLVVTLDLSAADANGVPRVRLSNDDVTFTTVDFAAVLSWTLAGEDGTKTVYLKFEDAAGNLSQTYQATTTLDTVAPSGSVVIEGASAGANGSSVTLSLAASDNIGPVSLMSFNNEGMGWSAWEPFAPSKDWTLLAGLGETEVQARYQDAAGNISGAFRGTILREAVDTVSSGNPSVAPISEVEVSFSQITAGGEVEVTRVPVVDFPRLTQFRVLPSSAYAISTSASYDGVITICLAYSDDDLVSPEKEDALRLFHYTSDITTVLNTSANRICGESRTLSPFYVVEPSTPQKVPVGQGGWSLLSAAAAFGLIAYSRRRDGQAS